MLDTSQELLTGLLLRSFLCGCLLGVLYSIIKITRVAVKEIFGDRGKAFRIFEFIFIFTGDVFFGICAGIVSILLIYHVNYGMFRGMVYLGMIFGFLLYYLTVGKLVQKISEKLMRGVIFLIKKLIFILLMPFYMIFKGLFFIYRLTIGKIIAKIIMALKKRSEKRKSVLNTEAQVADDLQKENL